MIFGASLLLVVVSTVVFVVAMKLDQRWLALVSIVTFFLGLTLVIIGWSHPL